LFSLVYRAASIDYALMTDKDDELLSDRARRLTRHLPEIGTFLPKTRPPMRGAKRAGSFARKAADKSLKRFGMGGGDIIRYWPQIAGERLARLSRPEQIKKTPEGDVLVLKVARAAAMEIQHKVPDLLDRANRLAGAGRLIRIEIVQGPLG
jgi:hypothetical protein